LVTGATGLVGVEICKELTIRGHTVVGLSRGRRSVKSGNLEDWALDLKDLDKLSAWSEGRRCDAIVHAASEIDLAPYGQSLIASNCLGTLNTIWLAEKWKVEKLVYISSVQVLGSSPKSMVDETSMPNPYTTYHATKLFGESVVSAASERGIDSISLRISAPIGLNMPKHRFLSALFHKASRGEAIELLGIGTRRQDYVDTRDVGAAVVQSLTPGKSGLFHIASGIPKSNLELAELVNGLFGNRSEIVLGKRKIPDDSISWEISIEKARRDLAWTPSHTLSDTLNLIRNSTRSIW